MWWHRIHLKYTCGSINCCNTIIQAWLHVLAGTLFTCGRGVFGIFCSALVPHQFTADLHCYYFKPLNTAVCQHSSEKCVYGLLTSREYFQSPGVSFHFQVSAQVNMAIRASAICQDSRRPVTIVKTRGLFSKGQQGRGIRAAPCWLLCTGKRTSVCLTGLRTLSEQSSGCSHVKPELQEI